MMLLKDGGAIKSCCSSPHLLLVHKFPCHLKAKRLHTPDTVPFGEAESLECLP